ncbi:MAG: FAD/NAD(P)-binding protein, partial [Pyrinomonadaceae bacterium]
MKRITIIGGGASGTLLAINLLKYSGGERVEINLVEKRTTVGRGVAFGTEHDVHLLNVPAGKMGAFPDDVEHFHRWLGERGHDFEQDAFVPRKYFAEYLRAILEDALMQAVPNVVLNIFDSEALRLVTNESAGEVTLEDGSIIYSEAIVLAFGNFLPPHPNVPDLSFTGSDKYFQDAWSPESDTKIDRQDSVLIIGTGLSMAD